MPTLTISRVSASKQRVVVTADSGDLIECYEANLLSARAQKRLVEATGIPAHQIAGATLQVIPKQADPVEIVFATPGGVEAGPFAVVVRGIEQPLDAGTSIEASTPAAAVLRALELGDCPHPDPVVQWDGTDRVCCLDVDYHLLPFDQRPPAAWLESKAAGLQPRAFAFHASHGRGVKFYFVEQPGFTARELAAVAAVGWLSADVRATADLVRISRLPRFPSSKHGGATGGPVYTQTPGTDLAPMGRWLQRTVDPFAVDDWLAARGWDRGKKYEHADCLIDPSPSHGEPVYVGDDGVFCHKCAAAGRSLGRTPGFTPFVSLVGGFPPRAATMLKNATHWAHARLILKAETRMPDGLLREAYSAALKMTHGGDSPAAAAAMIAGEEIIRMPGRWYSADGTTSYDNKITGMIGALPATWVPGTREISPERRDLFLQGGDLSKYGYPAVTPVHGCPVYGHFLSYADGRVTLPLPASYCRDPKLAPKYVPPKDRVKLSDARAEIEAMFPGVNWRYVELLIALKGLAEGQAAQAPFAIVTGPSSSAKSSTAMLAASICGDWCSDAKFVSDGVRLLQTIAEGVDKGSFVVLNEVFKEAQRAKLTPRAAVDPILTMTPSVLAHRMYIGPRPLGKLPALVLTDINIPPAVLTDVQLARRLVWVRQTSRVDWETAQKHGLTNINHYRAHSPEAAAACNAVLSDVIDRYFRHPVTVKEVAADLGLGTLEEAGGVADVRDSLRELFHRVLAAPDLTGTEKQRFPGGGWKAIDRGDTSRLRDLWDEIADGLQGEEWHESRIAEAEDWRLILGSKDAVRFERGHYRGKTYVRFYVEGMDRRKPAWTSAAGSPLLEGVAPLL